MNKLLLSLVVPIALCVAGAAYAADFTPAQGQVHSKTFGDVKVHDYVAKTGGAAQVVEKDKLVVFDVPGNAAQNQDFQAFVQSLGKPVEAVIISHGDDHHWLGADVVFPGVKMYSLDADAVTPAALANAKKTMGADMVPYTTVPQVEKLAEGARTFDGVEYVFVRLPDLGSTIIEMPAQKVAMVHHLGYVGVHVPMAPFDQRLAQLQALDKNGYAWIVAGHGAPGDSVDFVQKVADYYAFVQKAMAESKTPEEAKALIVRQYPSYNSVFLLDIMLPGLMKK